MKRSSLAGTTLIVALLVAGGASGAVSQKKVTCTFDLTDVSAATSVQAEHFGAVDCQHGFGKGVQHDTAVTALTSQTTGVVTGRYKQFFDAGTIRGTLKLALTATPSGAINTRGTVTIAHGTGAYRHVKGSARITCASSDSGVHTRCTEKATLTHG